MREAERRVIAASVVLSFLLDGRKFNSGKPPVAQTRKVVKAHKQHKDAKSASSYIYDMILNNPGLTSPELAALLGIKTVMFYRRIRTDPDLNKRLLHVGRIWFVK